MFSRWGAFVYRHRQIVLVLAIVVGIAAGDVRRAAPHPSCPPAAGWTRTPSRPPSPTVSPTSSAPDAAP